MGFVGACCLNAFNALEYAEANGREQLAAEARSIFDSYLRYGFTPGGLIREVVDFKREREADVYSIRRQSEGLYALLNYLDYEKRHGRSHPRWEAASGPCWRNSARSRIPTAVSPQIPRQPDRRGRLRRQHAFGHAAPDDGLRLFRGRGVPPGAVRTPTISKKNLISKADYFSSTLDANCEDKEASLYAATAMYYLTFISEGAERQRYCRSVPRGGLFRPPRGTTSGTCLSRRGRCSAT